MLLINKSFFIWLNIFFIAFVLFGLLLFVWLIGRVVWVAQVGPIRHVKLIRILSIWLDHLIRHLTVSCSTRKYDQLKNLLRQKLKARRCHFPTSFNGCGARANSFLLCSSFSRDVGFEWFLNLNWVANLLHIILVLQILPKHSLDLQSLFVTFDALLGRF